MIPQEMTKPAVEIYCQKGTAERERIRQLYYGIEEEGIPFAVQEREGSDAAKMAFEACGNSVLGAGIGISETEIVLQYEKLPEDHPLFQISIDAEAEDIRNLGANAARLVKKMPFKKIHQGGEVG